MPQKTCSCTQHKKNWIFPQKEYKNILRVKSDVRDFLWDKKWIKKKHRGHLCPNCIEMGQGVRAKEIKSGENVLINIDELKSDIKKDIKTLRKHVSLFDLLTYNPKVWLKCRPKSVLLFCDKLFGAKGRIMSNLKATRLALTIECMYGLHGRMLVLPLSFLFNLVSSRLTRCKTTTNIFGRLSPGGCSQHIVNWVKEETASPLLSLPRVDLKAMVDNTQKIGKTWQLKLASTAPSSVITCHVSTKPSSKSTAVQFSEKDPPKKWVPLPSSIKDVKMSTKEEGVFRKLRVQFLETRLARTADSKTKDEDVERYTDVLAKAKTVKYCVECACENDKNHQICKYCRSELEECSVTLDSTGEQVILGDYFPGICASGVEKLDLHIGDPTFANPNSYETVSELLREVGRRAGIKRYHAGTREWLLLEVDGTIYIMVIEMIFSSFVCEVCMRCFHGSHMFDEHDCDTVKKKMTKSQKKKRIRTREFDWLVPIAGLLHIEMNICKAFMKLNWQVFCKRICIELGFKTDKAQAMMYACKDHHKAWQFLEAVLFAFVDESLALYEKTARQHSIPDYMSWIIDQPDNHRFLSSMMLDYLFSIMVLRVSVRRNCFDGILIALKKFRDLFFVRHHPYYQKIITYHLNILETMPAGIKELYVEHMAGSISGLKDSAQGGDAIMEEINKRVKSWLPDDGVPTEEHWTESTRLLQNIDKLKQRLLAFCDITNDDDSIERIRGANRSSTSEDLILLVRCLMRELKILERTGPLSSIDQEEPLCDDLMSLHNWAEQNRTKYIAVLQKGDEHTFRYISVTKKDKDKRLNISSLTVTQIKIKIEKILEVINDEEWREKYVTKTKSPRTLKDVFIEFLVDLYRNFPHVEEVQYVEAEDANEDEE